MSQKAHKIFVKNRISIQNKRMEPFYEFNTEEMKENTFKNLSFNKKTF